MEPCYLKGVNQENQTNSDSSTAELQNLTLCYQLSFLQDFLQWDDQQFNDWHIFYFFFLNMNLFILIEG